MSKASVDSGTVQGYHLRKRVEVVKNCRNISKKDMKFNELMPKMKVDPETYVSACLIFGYACSDAKICKSRPSRQMELYVKRTLP